MTATKGWMICRYLGTCNEQEMAGEPIWDFIFPTRKAAEDYWYDTAPGCNDRCTYVKVAPLPIKSAYHVNGCDCMDCRTPNS